MRVAIFTLACVMAVSVAFAGNLDSTADPASTSSYTLEDIYKRVCAAESVTPSTFTEPTAGPTAGTSYPLNQIYRMIQAADAKTGQTACYDASHNPTACAGTGQDGEFQKGVAWPATRFTDNGDGTVTDNLTGLIWLKNANCTDTIGGIDPTATSDKLDWNNALAWSAGMAHGSCGLSDGSAAGDWRIPNIRGFMSLIDFSRRDPALPSGHFFTGVRSDYYWSSTKYAGDASYAWMVRLLDGENTVHTSPTHYAWPVRAGQ